jgi:ribosomal protein S18 acetylase RimI-like enzyme
MDEKIKGWLLILRLNWRHLKAMVKQVRGVVRDRKGRHYWVYIEQYDTGHFHISLCTWPGLTFSTSTCAGWISVGVTTESKASWEIHDLQVNRRRYRQRGIGTALVREAIALARRRGAQDLQGIVTITDAQENPFLSAWYARLGFTVQFYGVSNDDVGGGAPAFFRMDLSQALSSSTHGKPVGS